MNKNTMLPIVLCTCSLAGLAQEGRPIPCPEALERAGIALPSLAQPVNDALILGNGDLNALLFAEGDDLVVRITKNDVWDARVDAALNPPLPTLERLKQLGQGEWPDRNWILPEGYAYDGQDAYHAHPYPCPRACGVVRIPGAAKGLLTAALNLRVAEASVVTAEGITRVLTPAQTNVILLRSEKAPEAVLEAIVGGRPPRRGQVRLGHKVTFNYYAQAHEGLDADKSVLDELLTVRNLPLSEARNYLAAYLFTGDDVFRPVSTLSGGERGRLALAKLSLDGANFLLLDEPTNHLDIESQEILQDVLAAFNGTILLVSHDRYLIDALATQVWDLQADGLTIFEGTYREYLATREAARQAARDADSAAPAERRRDSAERRQNGGAGLSDYQRQRRLVELEGEITALEDELDALHDALSEASTGGEVEQVRDLGERYAAIESVLDRALSEWEALVE